MSRLTDRTYITAITSTDLIHVVVTGDTSQSADGSSYKATIQQLTSILQFKLIIWWHNMMAIGDKGGYYWSQVLEANQPPRRV